MTANPGAGSGFTSVAGDWREALRAQLAAMELHDATGEPGDEGYMLAVVDLRDWLDETTTTAPRPDTAPTGSEPVYEYRACVGDTGKGAEDESVAFDEAAQADKELGEMLCAADPPYTDWWIERRITAGEWERVEASPYPHVGEGAS